MHVCTSCDGFGKHFSRPIFSEGKVRILELPCELCNSTGKISDKKMEWVIQGKKLREYRLNIIGMSLRKAAKLLKIDVSYFSKMERGIMKPRDVWNILE